MSRGGSLQIRPPTPALRSPSIADISVRAEAGVDFGQTRRRFRSRANAKKRSISELDGAGQQVFLLMMEKVLCVCLGNISRSPMMQAVLQ